MPAGDHRPDSRPDWAKRLHEEGVPIWAVWEAWNEADDDDTVGQIRARALVIAERGPRAEDEDEE